MAYSIMLKDRGGFDPALLHAFVSTLGIYPPGNRVRLNDGRQGIVVAAGTAIDKPFVRITRDVEGSAVEEDAQRILNLAEDINGRLAVTELLPWENP